MNPLDSFLNYFENNWVLSVIFRGSYWMFSCKGYNGNGPDEKKANKGE